MYLTNCMLLFLFSNNKNTCYLRKINEKYINKNNF